MAIYVYYQGSDGSKREGMPLMIDTRDIRGQYIMGP